MAHQPLRMLRQRTRKSYRIDPRGIVGGSRIAHPDDCRRSWQRSQVHAVAKIVVDGEHEVELLALHRPKIRQPATPPEHDTRSMHTRFRTCVVGELLTGHVHHVDPKRRIPVEDFAQLARRPAEPAETPKRGIEELVGDDTELEASTTHAVHVDEVSASTRAVRGDRAA